MKIPKKVGSGLKVAGMAGILVTYVGYSYSIFLDLPQIEMLQELVNPIKSGIEDIKKEMDYMQPNILFCELGRESKYLNESGLQECSKVDGEYVKLRKELEPLQQKHYSLQKKIEEVEIANYKQSNEFAGYGLLGSFGLLGLGYLISFTRHKMGTERRI